MRTAAIAIVLIVIVVLAVVMTVVRTRGGAGGVPSAVAEKAMDVYDVDADKKIQVTTIDWEKNFQIDEATGYRINPSTMHKLARIITCASCKQEIPEVAVPVKGAARTKDIHAGYRCPECGKPAYPEGL
jgi:DNA-directed RNA polymerase subunit RPC12/RpoP